MRSFREYIRALLRRAQFQFLLDELRPRLHLLVKLWPQEFRQGQVRAGLHAHRQSRPNHRPASGLFNAIFSLLRVHLPKAKELRHHSVPVTEYFKGCLRGAVRCPEWSGSVRTQL